MEYELLESPWQELLVLAPWMVEPPKLLSQYFNHGIPALPLIPLCIYWCRVYRI
jgi:hypothetical protein